MNTTPDGLIRIQESLNSDIEDVVEYCKNKIRDKNCKISKEGRNWICITDDIKIIVNSCSYTIITVKKDIRTIEVTKIKARCEIILLCIFLLRYLFASDSTEYCNISDSVRTLDGLYRGYHQ